MTWLRVALANWKLIGLALLLGLMGWQFVRVADAQKATAEAHTDLAQYRATAAESARLAARAERMKEDLYQANTRKVVDEARVETAVARADAVRADTAAGRLQGQLAAVRAAAERARADTAAAGRGQGEPSTDAIGMFAGLLERADRRAGVVERYADALRIAGSTCERYADGLQPAAP